LTVGGHRIPQCGFKDYERFRSRCTGLRQWGFRRPSHDMVGVLAERSLGPVSGFWAVPFGGRSEPGVTVGMWARELHVPGAQVPKPPRRSARAATRTCTLSTCSLQVLVRCAAQGSRTPFASPNGEQRGGWGGPSPPALTLDVGSASEGEVGHRTRVLAMCRGRRGARRTRGRSTLLWFDLWPLHERAPRSNTPAPAGCCASKSTNAVQVAHAPGRTRGGC
jgi:hypothetical protein